MPSFNLKSLWDRLFKLERPAAIECLLIVLLIKAIRDGVVAATMTPEVFYRAAAFQEAAIEVVPVGWTFWIPSELILSLSFFRAIGWLVAISCTLWLFKSLLPYSAAVGTLSFGFLTSLGMSRAFGYMHETMPATACLTIFGLFYVWRDRTIHCALLRRRFWGSRIYPGWVFTAIVLYMGTYYTYSGLSKVILGGFSSTSGLTLQILLARKPGPLPFAAIPIADSRMFANVVMTASVIIEVFAIGALFNRFLRPLWCILLSGMHIMILLAMAIPFKANIAVLLWLGYWSQGVVAWITRALDRLRIQIRINKSQQSVIRTWLCDRLYAIDCFRVFAFR